MKRSRSQDELSVEDSDGAVGSGFLSDFVCRLPPHCVSQPSHFASLTEFESHYFKFHSWRCVSCQKVFPSEWFLNLHITEHHDPLAQVRRGRGDKIYGCVVEGCDKLCSNAWKRRRHVIDKHGYPGEFDFGIIQHGISSDQASLLRTKPGS